eukprot:4633-Heterococcus_DN1.PRE.3
MTYAPAAAATRNSMVLVSHQNRQQLHGNNILRVRIHSGGNSNGSCISSSRSKTVLCNFRWHILYVNHRRSLTAIMNLHTETAAALPLATSLLLLAAALALTAVIAAAE